LIKAKLHLQFPLPYVRNKDGVCARQKRRSFLLKTMYQNPSGFIVLSPFFTQDIALTPVTEFFWISAEQNE
jgi:hypothetical protein